MQKLVVGLFVGRFQPGLHFGEFDGIQQAIEKGVTHFVIAIGSSNKEFTKENPFTYDERKVMIDLSFSHVSGITYQTFGVPDFPTDKERKDYILRELPAFDYVITGNPRVREIFQKRDECNKKVIWLKIRKDVKGTFLRDQLALGNFDELKRSLYPDLIAYLKKIKADRRMMDIFRSERRTPNLCVDVIFKDSQGRLVLIERKEYPYGIALPGGFVGYGEDPKDAAVREVKEELGVNIKIKKLVGVYGDPHRDPRAHMVSIVYEGAYVSGVFKAGDDAKAVKKVKNVKDELKKMNFCFDHKKIIEEYLKD